MRPRPTNAEWAASHRQSVAAAIGAGRLGLGDRIALRMFVATLRIVAGVGRRLGLSRARRQAR